MAILYLFPTIYLFKTSAALKDLIKKADIQHIEDAVRYQKSFWKFTGVLALIWIVFAILGMLAAIIIPFMAALKR